jgi:hypothetical protein
MTTIERWQVDALVTVGAGDDDYIQEWRRVEASMQIQKCVRGHIVRSTQVSGTGPTPARESMAPYKELAVAREKEAEAAEAAKAAKEAEAPFSEWLRLYGWGGCQEARDRLAPLPPQLRKEVYDQLFGFYKKALSLRE